MVRKYIPNTSYCGEHLCGYNPRPIGLRGILT